MSWKDDLKAKIAADPPPAPSSDEAGGDDPSFDPPDEGTEKPYPAHWWTPDMWAAYFRAQEEGRARAAEKEALADERMVAATKPVRLSQVVATTADWRITGLLEKDWVLLLWAAAKTGKTTLIVNLAKCLLSGEPFLGKFDVCALEAGTRVGILNYEMNAAQFRGWADLHGVDADRVAVWNLRGMPNPVSSKVARRMLAAEIKAEDVGYLIIDTYSRAMIGDNEDSNPAATAWFKILGELLAAADVSEVMVTHHAGHNATRLRGASALRDNPDCLWGLTLGEGGEMGPRYFEATGRFAGAGGGLERQGLEFDVDTLTVRLGGVSAADEKGSSAAAKKAAKGLKDSLESQALLALLPVFVDAGGGVPSVAGLSGNKAKKALYAQDILTGNSGRLDQLLAVLGDKVVTKPGPRNSEQHWRKE